MIVTCAHSGCVERLCVPGLALFVSWWCAPQLACSMGSPVGAGHCHPLTHCSAGGLKLFALFFFFLTICRRVTLTFIPSSLPFTSPYVPLLAGGPALWWMAWVICHTTDTNVYCWFKRVSGWDVRMNGSFHSSIISFSSVTMSWWSGAFCIRSSEETILSMWL